MVGSAIGKLRGEGVGKVCSTMEEENRGEGEGVWKGLLDDAYC